MAECAKHGIRGSRVMAHPDAKVLEELTKLIEANKITPIAHSLSADGSGQGPPAGGDSSSARKRLKTRSAG
jgi:hypothetical protein